MRHASLRAIVLIAAIVAQGCVPSKQTSAPQSQTSAPQSQVAAGDEEYCNKFPTPDACAQGGCRWMTDGKYCTAPGGPWGPRLCGSYLSKDACMAERHCDWIDSWGRCIEAEGKTP